MAKKKEAKSDVVLEMERQEAVKLRELIINSTNRVPDKLRNGGSYQDAVAFKKFAVKARGIAEKHNPPLQKLQEAWNLISGYY